MDSKLPPYHLNRIPQSELLSLFVGYGYEPIIVEGSDPGLVHPAMAKALDYRFDKITTIKRAAASQTEGRLERPSWPMIIMRTPKGWTGPKIVDGQKIEGSYRAHQVPTSSTSRKSRTLGKPFRMVGVSF
jgi:xylulose-5-phosphate/fructose-6-phosphate phosphoketolase